MKAAAKHLEIDLTTGPLPASRKIFVQGNLHKDVYVPLREISLSSQSQEQPLHVYDSSGPYTDTEEVVLDLNIEEGLPRLREAWIRARGDVEEYTGREVRPEDNGFATNERLVPEFPAKRTPLRARDGLAVTQLEYARSGIVTPEMEFVAIRENLGRERNRATSERDG